MSIGTRLTRRRGERVTDLRSSALDSSRKARIATFTMRGKEYLTTIRAQESVLVLP